MAEGTKTQMLSICGVDRSFSLNVRPVSPRGFVILDIYKIINVQSTVHKAVSGDNMNLPSIHQTVVSATTNEPYDAR